MTQRLTPGTAALLVIPPLLWAGNAVTGRLVHDLIPPITLNFIRWVLAFFILLPLAYNVLRKDSPLWPHWRRYALLGLLGIGLYNALQYMALQTSTPINVTLVGSSMPVWMLAVGALFFGATVTRRQLLGALLSMCGVLLVLSRGEWSQLMAFRLVPGDLFMLLATVSWAFYSWLLSRTSEPASIRWRGGFPHPLRDRLRGAAGTGRRGWGWVGSVGIFRRHGGASRRTTECTGHGTHGGANQATRRTTDRSANHHPGGRAAHHAPPTKAELVSRSASSGVSPVCAPAVGSCEGMP